MVSDAQNELYNRLEASALAILKGGRFDTSTFRLILEPAFGDSETWSVTDLMEERCASWMRWHTTTDWERVTTLSDDECSTGEHEPTIECVEFPLDSKTAARCVAAVFSVRPAPVQRDTISLDGVARTLRCGCSHRLEMTWQEGSRPWSRIEAVFDQVWQWLQSARP